MSPEVTVRGFQKCHIFSAVGGTDDDMLWNDSKEVVNIRSESEEDEGTVEMETVTLVCKGRICHAL